jgi:hypothetical protein
MEIMDLNRSESLCPVSGVGDEIRKQSRARKEQAKPNAPKQNDRHLASTISSQLVICEF